MRTRTSGGVIGLCAPHIYTWSRYNPSHIDLGAYGFFICDGFSRITDDPKKRFVVYTAGKRRLAFKSVTHLKWDATNDQSVRTFQTSANNWQTSAGGQVMVAFSGAPDGHGSGDDVATRTLNKGLLQVPVLQSAVAQWDKAKPSMSTRANLSVFLWELRDLKRMFQILPSKHLTWGAQKQKMRSWKDVLMYVNNQHLNYNFGWKPFIKDIKNVFNGVCSFEERLSKFVRRADEELTRHARSEPQTVSWDMSDARPYPFSVRWTGSLTAQAFSTFDLIYSLPAMSEGKLRWLSWLDTLGLGVSPSTIWAVIPWSFVVDWFINVSGALEQREDDWVQPNVTLHQACYSTRISGTSTSSILGSIGGETAAVSNVSFSLYTRTVGVPDFRLATNPLDADKIRLGSSLVLSLLR